MGKCKFHDQWLHQKDSNECVVCDWGVKDEDNNNKLYCKLCKFSFDVSNQGFHAILQHSSTKKHQKLSSDLGLHQTRLKLVPTSSSSEVNRVDQIVVSDNKVPSTIQIYSLKDQDIVREVMWVLMSVKCNFSFSSSQGLPEVFKFMFPGKESDNFTMSPTKLAYYLTDAIGPYFKTEMLEEACNQYYSLAFDETTNEKGATIRFWSDGEKKVVSRHLKTSFLSKANAFSLHSKLQEILTEANLPLQKLVMLESDGPNVNKTVWRLFNEDVLSVRSKGLVDIGTCSIHTIHNGFLKALECLGEDISELATAIFNYFHGRPERIGDYDAIQEKLKLLSKSFVRHTTTRWLTLMSAAERLIEQWNGIQEYFLKLLPTKAKSSVLQSFSVKKITSLLKKPGIKAEALFVVSSAKMFSRFTELFQREDPLIQVLCSELESLIKKVIGKVCKPAVIKEFSFSSGNFDELLNDSNLLPLKDLRFSEEIQSELQKLKEIDRMKFLKDAQQHFIKGCEHLLKKTPVTSKLVQALGCLQPQRVTCEKSLVDIVHVAKSLPVSVSSDQLMDEWKLLSLESDLPRENKADAFWNKIFSLKTLSGDQKYPAVSKVVRVALVLYHGNADIERRFSVSGFVLTEGKTSMIERTLDAVMMVKDELRFYQNILEVPIPQKLIASARVAYKSHNQYLE